MNTIENNDLNTKAIIILCTFPNEKNCITKLIQTLLKEKLAACISLFYDTHSFYYWNNKLEKSIELQLLIKTTKPMERLVFEKIRSLHPYKVPELLTLPIINADPKYLKWIRNSISN